MYFENNTIIIFLDGGNNITHRWSQLVKPDLKKRDTNGNFTEPGEMPHRKRRKT